MTTLRWLGLLVLISPVTWAQKPSFAGRWYTTRGLLDLEISGRSVTGKYGDGHQISGELADRGFAFTGSEGRTTIEGTIAFEASGHRFSGSWQSRGDRGTWNGWRHDPAVARGKPISVAGAWRTSFGLLQLDQSGTEVTGGYGAAGWSQVRGQVRGRHVELTYESPFGTGTMTLDVDEDRKSAFGGARSERGDWPLVARRLEGFTVGVKPKPGEIVQGLGKNRLTYYLRVPKGWKSGDGAPLVVILHGSNMSARPYVESLAAHPSSERHVILGVDGEQWQDWSTADDPRHNYTYVNYMGRSTYQGYPNTHRESPALVAELLEELKSTLKPRKIFVGGHSQGGFLSWFFAMHHPELVDGIFPVASGMVMQCEPDVFTDAALLAAQRKVAIAVVHGRRDPTVAFSQGHGTFQSVQEHGFPLLRLFANDAGHGFSSLPWAEALAWLTAITSDDAHALTTWANERLDAGDHRDAAGALWRLRGMRAVPRLQAAVVELTRRLDALVAADAPRHAKRLASPPTSSDIDEFLEFRDRFEFAPAAKEAMTAFATMRAAQEPRAKTLLAEARAAFRDGRRDEGWAKYEELVRTCPASSSYRRVKTWLAER